MKIATFNANSIRVRQEIVLEWMAATDADVLAIQETKCEDAKFPEAEIRDAGYELIFDGQQKYNGVAFLSKMAPTNVRKGFGDPAWPDDKRILAATFGNVRVINTYVPNGTKVGSEKWDYKLRWFERFREYLAMEMRANEHVLWLGDINVAPEPEDVFDHEKMLGGICHHPDEFSRLAAIKELGLTDVFRTFHPEPGHFTYWEFVIPRAFERNLGWRIDHLYATPALAALATACEIDRVPRSWERPSDHTFVYGEFSL